MNEQVKDLGLTNAVQLPEPLQVDPAQPVDLLVRAINYFCNHHDLPFSSDRALRGIPLNGEILTTDSLDLACQNLGLVARAVEIRPSAVSEMVCPFLVYFRNGSIGIVESKFDKNHLNVVQFDLLGKQSNIVISKREIDQQTVPAVHYVTKLVDGSVQSGPEPNKTHWFWGSVRRFWPSWSYVVFATFLVNLLGLALPLFVMNVYDRVIPNNSISTLWALAIGVSLALGFDLLLKILRSAMIDNSGKRIDLAVSSRVFEHALDVKMEHRQTKSGELANHVREFDSVRDFFSSGAIISLIDLLFIGIFLGFLWFIVGPLALVPLIAVPVVLLVTLLVQLPLNRSIRNSQSASGNRHSILVESLVGVETVKSVAAESAMQKRWEDAVTMAARAGATTRFWSSLAIFFTMFAQQAVSVLVIVWGVFLVAAGEITIGALIAANILAGRILSPLGGISNTLVRAQQAFASLGNLNALMKLDRDNPKRRGTGARIHSGAVEFRDVELKYPGQLAAALSGLSLSISPGERVGIIGRVGSGKSTMGKLVCGLYQSTAGGVLVDGTDTKHLDLADLRRNVAYVGQETELFSGSLRDNITIASPHRSEFLQSCLDASGVTAFASRHPLGLEMQVGERGKLLSGGQKQAVGIARALLADSKVIFLDEPTAQMDTMTEAAFVKTFGNWLTSSTTLVIATHRNTLLDLVDRIVVIENGKVALDGPKAQVLRSLKAKPASATKKAGGKNAKH